MISSEEIYGVIMPAMQMDSEQRMHYVVLVAVTLGRAGIKLNKFAEFVLELVDPAYGIGRELPEPYGSEQKEFCRLLKAGDVHAACKAILKILTVGDSGFSDKAVPQEYKILSLANKASVAALLNAATVLRMPAKYFDVTLILPMFFAVWEILVAYKAEQGVLAMEAMARRISDRLAETLNSP